jgi:aminodeoxyfutalosine synthase
MEADIWKGLDEELSLIGSKVLDGIRLSQQEGVALFEKGDLGFLGMLANHVREKRHGDKTYFNRNFHIEPTNLCVFDCKFCAYSRKLRQADEGWTLTRDEMLDIVRSYNDKAVTEVHIVGGVHPKLDLEFFEDLIRSVKEIRPELHVKALTAVEYEYIFRKAKVSVREGLQRLKDAGLESLPGGGAEIFAPAIREKICADKATTEQWLEIHETAHELGLPSNATILYGHIESYADRIDHMDRLRNLQDKTGKFNTFIPLKFRNGDNQMSDIKEVSVVEDLKNYAVSRIYLDNFEHIKAYWPMIGREKAQMSLAYGVNDIDGTIDDSTKIYSMAGSEEQSPVMSTEEIVDLIKSVGRQPIERGTLYDVIKDYSEEEPAQA